MKDYPKEVTILCFTFNHAPYIRRTLDSFVNQKTDFDYEIIVHDDASTDGTQEIIKEFADKYPDLFVTVLQTKNQYSQGIDISKNFVFPIVRGKYIAYCEGDDYWPDDHMLQKEYDFLTSHPDYSSAAGVTRYFNDDNVEVRTPLPAKKYVNRDVDEKNYLNIEDANVATNTIMGISDIIHDENYLKAKEESPRVGDILIVLKYLEAGKMYVFEDVFQNHTIQSREGASNYNSLFNWEEKLTDIVKVISVVDNYYEKEHDFSKWYDKYAYNSFINAVKEKKTREFMEIQSSLPEKYQRSLISYCFVYGMKYLSGKLGLG